MKKLNLKTLAIYGLAVLSGIVLLYTSQSVQKAEDRLAAIQSSAQTETEAIRVLKAEWAYLNSPERLEALAKEFLALKPADPSRIIPETALLPNSPVPIEQPAEPLYQEVSQPALNEPTPPDMSITPQKKPASTTPRTIPMRAGSGRTTKEKSFDHLINELEGEGAP